jgi:hypothetical protein
MVAGFARGIGCALRGLSFVREEGVLRYALSSGYRRRGERPVVP